MTTCVERFDSEAAYQKWIESQSNRVRVLSIEVEPTPFGHLTPIVRPRPIYVVTYERIG